MNVAMLMSELRVENKVSRCTIESGLNGSLIKCSEESESVRRIYLLLGRSCESWERQENMAMSSAVHTEAMLRGFDVLKFHHRLNTHMRFCSYSLNHL